MLEIAFAAAAVPTSGALALLIGEGEAPAGVWQAAEQATGGAIGRALASAEFTGKKGQSATLLAPGAGFARVVAVGLGKAAERTRLLVEEAGGTAASLLAREPVAAMAADLVAPELAAAAAHGAVLRSYRFDRYRTQEKADEKPRLARLSVLATDSEAARAAHAPMQAVAEGAFFTRDLVSEPANVLNPAEFAERCRPFSELGLAVEVLGPAEMRELGFGALLGVAQGSVTSRAWSCCNGRACRPRGQPRSRSPSSARG